MPKVEEDAAGMRKPKSYKRYLGDKLPDLVNKLKDEGVEQNEIRNHVEKVVSKSIDKSKTNLRSNVGQILQKGELINRGDLAHSYN